MDKRQFIHALESNSLAALQAIPKSDLHNHAGRGGHISYIEKMLDMQLPRLTTPLKSVAEMDEWFRENIRCHFPDKSGWIQRIAAAFVQAKDDNIAVLALSFGVDEVYWMGGIEVFAAVVNGLHCAFAPDTIFLPELALWNATDLHKLDELIGANLFAGVDINTNTGMLSVSDRKAMSKKAHKHQLTVKSHVGEFGGADDVMRHAEELELDQVQHGIAAAESPQVMSWLASHKIQLNVCPTSNIMLCNTKSYATHQIRTLFDYGVLVTINTDDLLIFNATVSEEYLNLYNAGLMTAEELNTIRETGLRSAI